MAPCTSRFVNATALGSYTPVDREDVPLVVEFVTAVPV
jgi:hypothetical protein